MSILTVASAYSPRSEHLAVLPIVYLSIWGIDKMEALLAFSYLTSHDNRQFPLP